MVSVPATPGTRFRTNATQNQPASRLIRFGLDTFWFVLPTLPMFWLFARLHGLACLVTVLLFRLELTLLRRLGLDWP